MRQGEPDVDPGREDSLAGDVSLEPLFRREPHQGRFGANQLRIDRAFLMQLINATGMQAGYTMGLEPSGRELLVVVVKGTFTIPDDPNEEPRLADEQVPLVDADVFTGEPGFSAPLYESDYAPQAAVRHLAQRQCLRSRR